MHGLERPRHRWILTVCLVIVLVFALALLVATVGSPTAGTISFEFRKYVIQFLLIVALGAVVAFVVDVLKRRAEREEEERRNAQEIVDRERQYAIDTLTSLLERLDAIYGAVKRTRRSFRRVPITELSKQAYVDAMSRFSDEKQDVEKLWKDMEVLERWLPELKAIRPSVVSMEDYLDPLEDESETVGSTRDDEFQAESLEALRGFYSKWGAGESNFDLFRNPYYKARSDLMTLLASRRLGVHQRKSN